MRSWLLAPAAIAILTGLLVFGAWHSGRRGEESSLMRIRDNAAAVAISIAQTAAAARYHTEVLALDSRLGPTLTARDADALTALCNDFIASSPDLDVIAVFDDRGRILAMNTVDADRRPIEPWRIARILNRRFDDRPIITGCLGNDTRVETGEFQTACDFTPALFDSSGLSVAFSVPVTSGGVRRGVLSTRLNFRRITGLIGHNDFLSQGNRIDLVSDQGKYFDERINAGLDPAPIPEHEVRAIVSAIVPGQALGPFVRRAGHRLLAAPARVDHFLEGGRLFVLITSPEEWIGRVQRVQTTVAGVAAGIAGIMILALVSVQRARARAAAEMLRARNQAEAASRAKSQFLANVSHEIRTPMTAILGYADLLAEPGSLDGPRRAEAVEIIRRNGHHLLELINDVLDLSKIEAGRMALERIPTRPASVVDDAALLMRPRAEAKGLTLEVRHGPGVQDLCIAADPTRLRQILANLVGNAVKFTDTGGVSVSTRVDPSAATLTIEVRDTGIGMNPAELGRLFQPFTQADASTTRRFGGTGLGLSICRRLADAMNAQLTVDSAPGRGSTFTLTLRAITPAAASPSPAPAAQRPAPDPVRPLEGVRVLLAEDGLDNQRLIALLLRRAGAAVELAATGLAALQAVRAAAGEGRPFDLVLMDMQMPEMDGYEATRRLRATPGAPPVLALTAHSMPEDRDRCLRAGCVAYLPKPIDAAALIAACAAHASRSPHVPAPSAPDAPAAAEPSPVDA